MEDTHLRKNMKDRCVLILSCTDTFVRNEISYLDLNSGESISLRKGHLSDPDTPIESIKVSNLKQYFLVLFKDKPLEYWDLFTLSPLRVLSAPSPIATAVEWAPANMTGKMRMQQSQRKPGKGETYHQEVYLMADVDGILYQVSSFSGNAMFDGSNIGQNLTYLTSEFLNA